MEHRNKRGQFTTGNPGRPKGTSLSKISQDLREALVVFLSENFAVTMDQFNKIDTPEKKVKMFIELLSFALPRLKAAEQVSELGSLTSEELQFIIDKLKQDHEEAIRQASAN